MEKSTKKSLFLRFDLPGIIILAVIGFIAYNIATEPRIRVERISDGSKIDLGVNSISEEEMRKFAVGDSAVLILKISKMYATKVLNEKWGIMKKDEWPNFNFADGQLLYDSSTDSAHIYRGIVKIINNKK